MTQTLAHCPICAARHVLSRYALTPRHGFSAKNVRHGHTGGFHIGGHGGHFPIGTERGNGLALRTATEHDMTADRLAALPPVTQEEAVESSITEAFAGTERRWRDGGMRGERPVRPTLETINNDMRWMPYRGWFTGASLEGRARRMMQQRAATVDAHRAHAQLLRELVGKNPA